MSGGLLLRALKRFIKDYAAAHPGWTPTKERTLAEGGPVFCTAALGGAGRLAGPRGAALPGLGGQHQARTGITVRTASIALPPSCSIFLPPPTLSGIPPTRTSSRAPSFLLVGEMLRRGYPSRWVYRELRDEGDQVSLTFKIQLNDDEGYAGPPSALHHDQEWRSRP